MLEEQGKAPPTREPGAASEAKEEKKQKRKQTNVRQSLGGAKAARSWYTGFINFLTVTMNEQTEVLKQ